MRPIVRLDRALSSFPSGGYIEVVQVTGSASGNEKQYLPLSAISAAPGGDLVPPLVPLGSPQALSGAGAVTLTEYKTNFTSTGAAEALTLADGTEVGQLKHIEHVVDGGSGVLTPTTFVDGTDITFTTAGEYATLIWTATGWAVVDLGNVTAGGAAPAVG